MSHPAIFIVGPRAPLELREVPTPKATGNQVRVRNEFTSTQPLDLHKADGGLLTQYPEIVGGGFAGTVVEIGDEVEQFQIGDKVFGYSWKTQQEKSYQLYTVTSENFVGKLPPNISLPEASTVPVNFVTVFHTVTHSLNLPLPWPKPNNYTPPAANAPILIWGGASSVGQYALQILTYYGYNNLIAVASTRHHAHLESLGATKSFDYTDPNIIAKITQEVQEIPYFFDCIGSAQSSIHPISQLAKPNSRIAILLPVIIKPPTPTSAPEYSMDPISTAKWAPDIYVEGVRTHFYDKNEFFARVLQPEIMPKMLGIGAVRPNRFRLVEGSDMLERAENALAALRAGVSGEKMVWRVADA